jgi:translation initiation factor 3 subunit H
VNTYLFDLEESSRLESDFDRLDLSTNSFLEKNLEFLNECLDDLATEQNKFQYYQRTIAKQQAQQNAWLQKRVCLFSVILFILEIK